jgi:outer membrane protein insertion porin family
MRLLTFVLLLAIPGSAQTATKRKTAPKSGPPKAAVQRAWPLLSVQVTGNRLYTDAQIIGASGLKVGQPVSEALFDAARARLVETGAFESVGFQFGPTADGKGYSGTLDVVEVEQLYSVRFEELPVTEKEVAAFMAERHPLFRDRIPGTQQMLDQYATALQELLSKKAFREKVSGRIVADRPGELFILFRPGMRLPAVAEVKFTGNQAVPSSQLQNTFSAVAVGTGYRETVMRQLLDTSIRPLYEARGRLKVSFPKIDSEPVPDVDGVRVNITVDEGPEYKFGEIRAAAGVLKPDEVVDLAGLKPGEIANFNTVDTAIDRIQQRLRVLGYMQSKTHVERTVHDKVKNVDLTFVTTAGPRFQMGRLHIQGLDIITEPAIRKLWAMKEGAPYNADYPAMFLSRVQEEGYFDNLRSTSFDQKIDEKTHSVDVTLVFKGGPDPDAAKPRPRP